MSSVVDIPDEVGVVVDASIIISWKRKEAGRLGSHDGLAEVEEIDFTRTVEEERSLGVAKG